ncbi:MAG: enoyl-CoA hydratase/isomerase family protein [Cohaesibacter sp.]|nr:enoyl-CoA hydratase/isomerase family protein [Cohaesibacter sp.]MCV6600511.1 enoyl-CoA hydratase/isomerase family protein [Cohaesibacter sp.]
MAQIELILKDNIAHLTLERPDKLNALSCQMLGKLEEFCQTIDEDRSIGVVILSGTGNAFCAGGDIDDWGQYKARDFAMRWLRDGNRAFNALARLRQPVIALLRGPVLGGGLELAACADIRIAEDGCRLALPETGIGMIPGWSGTQRLVRRFGASVIRRMVLFGESFDAEQARRLGLVDHVVAVGEGDELARNWAECSLRRGPLALDLCKMMINASEGEEREHGIDAMAGMAIAASEECAEGVAAFREKRRPVFRRSTSISDT